MPKISEIGRLRDHKVKVWLSVKLSGLSYCLFAVSRIPLSEQNLRHCSKTPKLSTVHISTIPNRIFPSEGATHSGGGHQAGVCVCVCVCSTGQASLTLPVALALNPPPCLGPGLWRHPDSGCQGRALMVCVCCSRSTDALRPDKWEPYPSLHISPPSHRPFAFLPRLSYATDEQSIESVFKLLCSINPVGDSGSVCERACHIPSASFLVCRLLPLCP